MDFGFGFNKQRSLDAAERFVQRGELQPAIAEYQKVLANDPADLMVTNAVGDLYSRSGDSEKAVEYFKRVGDAYATAGFTGKAIAIYKKVAKLDPGLDGILKLAELYTAQGQLGEARVQYLQAAEAAQQGLNPARAVAIFQSLLQADPENTATRVKLAGAYLQMGNQTDAWQALLPAVEKLKGRGLPAEAADILQKILDDDPSNLDALLLRASLALDNDDAPTAIQFLHKIPQLDSHADGLRHLLRACLHLNDTEEAGAAAAKLLQLHGDITGFAVLAEDHVEAGRHALALALYEQHADEFRAQCADEYCARLNKLAELLHGDPTALLSLHALLKRTDGDQPANEVRPFIEETPDVPWDIFSSADSELHSTTYPAPLEEVKLDVPVPPLSLAASPAQPRSLPPLEFHPPRLTEWFRDSALVAPPPEQNGPELHYTRAIAYRGAGLLDEAIAEFQLVMRAADALRPVPHRTESLAALAQCFLLKGIPGLAARWFEKALAAPGLDCDTQIALHYEAALACEANQDRTAARAHFLEAYAGNIDYRDVAERVRALKS